MSKKVPTAYELRPIGVNGAMEATTAHVYCSVECRDKKLHTLGPCFVEMAETTCDGLVCEHCDTPVEGSSDV